MKIHLNKIKLLLFEYLHVAGSKVELTVVFVESPDKLMYGKIENNRAQQHKPYNAAIVVVYHDINGFYNLKIIKKYIYPLEKNIFTETRNFNYLIKSLFVSLN